MTDLPPYMRIGDAAKAVGVAPHVLRYWETEFPYIKPSKSKGRQRVYSRKQVERLRLIRHLLHELGYTIKGARKVLARGAPFHVTPLKRYASNREEPMDQPEQPADPDLDFTVDEHGQRRVRAKRDFTITPEQWIKVFEWTTGARWPENMRLVFEETVPHPSPAAELSIGTIPRDGTLAPVEIALRDDSGEGSQFRARCDNRGDWELRVLTAQGWLSVAQAQKGDPNVIFHSDALPISVVLDFLRLVRAPVYSATVAPAIGASQPDSSEPVTPSAAR